MSQKVQECKIDLIELFEMANTYQVMSLVDHCSNLLTLFCTDAAEIKRLVDVFGNVHLNKYYDYLSLIKNINAIKV